MGAQNFTLWLEFELWQPSETDDPEDDFFNMQIHLAGGEKYALNVWTFKFFERVRQTYQQDGNYLSGNYLLPPDLFVTKLNRGLIETVVADLIDTGGLKEDWLLIAPHG